ncbi:MAG TPA: diguanylate cyclase [Acidiferrobacterales bacterium]|nr:diguanylate cyclase [Acidiferrobacterales bacterium]
MSNIASSSKRHGRFRFGVREKIVLILFATLLVTLSVSSLLALRAHKQDILEETNRRGHEAVHFIAQHLAYSVVSYDYHTLELLLQNIIRSKDIVYVRVDNTRGNVMAVAGTPPSASQNVQHYRADIRLNGDTLGQLHLGLSTERIVQTLATRQREALIGQLLAVVVVMLAGFLAISAIIIRPLTVSARIIGQNLKSGNDSPQRIPLNSTDEIGDLARGFNALQEHLDDARQKLESRVNHANQELQNAYQQLTVQANELRSLNQELELLSVTDPLTGLYNRRHFERLMESEMALSIRNDETISIILLDVDNFKTINEQYGHSGGDAVLRNVGRVIAEHIRHSDVACRYGGDEFFVLCRNATISNAVGFADALLDALVVNSFRPGGRNIDITVSIGVATIPGVHAITTAEEFFQCADEALRACKQRGRNSVLHYSMLDRHQKSGLL